MAAHGLQFPFEDGDRDLIYNEILKAQNDAISRAQERNQLFGMYSDQVEGITTPSTNRKSTNASNLVVPTTKKAHLEYKAAMYGWIKQDPKALVSPQSARVTDKQSAELEALLTEKSHQLKLNDILLDIIDHSGRYPYAVAHAGWKSGWKWERFDRYRAPDGSIVNIEEVPEGADYPVSPAKRIVPEDRACVRVVAPSDFYWAPYDATCIEETTAHGEIIRLSESELILGIEQYGYDPEAVDKILASGAGGGQEATNYARQSQAEDSGVESSSTDKTGLYDCMIWYTRLPCIRRGGELIFNSDYLYDWFCCVTCPSARAVLKCEFSPYEDCPYVMFYMCHNAESMMGDCIPKMLNSLQSEMNAHARYGIDSLQYALTPMFKMRESVAQRNSGFQAFPGAVLVYEQNADEIQPLVMPQTQVSSLQYLQYLELESQSLIASGGLGQLQSKVRKAAEIQSTQILAASKYEYYASNLSMGILKLFEKIVILHIDNMSDEGESWADEFGDTHHVTPDMLRAEFAIKVRGNVGDANPDIKRDRVMLVDKIATEFNLIAPKLPPKVAKRIWSSKRMVLLDLGVHDPEQYIGKEEEYDQPSAPPVPPNQSQGGLPFMNQGAQNGQRPPEGSSNGVGQPAIAA